MWIREIALGSVILVAALLSDLAFAQSPSPGDNSALLKESLHDSVLVYGRQPFHLLLTIAPAQGGGGLSRQAPPSMQGTLEIFWAAPDRYRLVLESPSFRQTKIVSGKQVEEHDEGDFFPRWLDNFVEALLRPLPDIQLPQLIRGPLMGGGSIEGPSGPAITIPRCAETSDRPGGITEETSIARICFDPSNPWFQGMLDFTRYVSFSDFEKFGDQMIPRTWSDDIPENLFVEGKVTLLKELSAAELKTIRVSNREPREKPIRTVFLSRKDIEEHIANVPDYEWPAKDSGKLEGYMIVYIRTDRLGKIRESYWESSDNYGLQDAGVELALKSSLKPMLVDGVAVQIEGPLVLHFKTHGSVSTFAMPDGKRRNGM